MLFKEKFGDFTFKHMINDLPVEEDSIIFEHFHAVYELLYFIQGDANFVIEEKQYPLKPHSLLLIKPGEHHQIFVSDSVDYERVVINFSEQDIPPSLAEHLMNCETVYNIEDSPLANLFTRISSHCEVFPGGVPLQELLKSTLIEILVYLCFSDNRVQKADHLDKNLSLIITYIKKNLTSINTVDDIADSLHMSTSSVRQIFFDYTKVPIMTYVRNKKCTLAHSLISKGHKATMVYEQCGFNDYSTFYRIYSKIYSHPPSRVRSTISQNHNG
jgi:AraC-like DNA-binding protein